MTTHTSSSPPGPIPGGGFLLDLKKDYDPRLAVVVGSGPSLRDFDRSQLDRNWINSIVINNEFQRAEGHFKPNIWIINDPPYYRTLAQSAYEPWCDVQIVLSSHIYEAAYQDQSGRYEVYEPLLRNAAFYRGTPRFWEPKTGTFLARKTTATAALCLAHWMGHPHVAMLGVDLYFLPDAYYYDGSKRGRANTRSLLEIRPGIFQDDRHIEMMADFVKWKWWLNRRHRPMEVSQCSILSPMTCFPKRNWANTVQFSRNPTTSSQS